MKIDLAVWTAVNGFAWQPGHAYSPKELAGYRDEIGTLDSDKLPLGGILKNGKVVVYRLQIAERIDSRGRDAIYCVLGTVTEDKAKGLNFNLLFNSDEMARPQKPFPQKIEIDESGIEYKLSLGDCAFDEKWFNGIEIFTEIGGWCEEARGGKLNVRITGSIEAPQFIVSYEPKQHQQSTCDILQSAPTGQQTKVETNSDESLCQLCHKPLKENYNVCLEGENTQNQSVVNASYRLLAFIFSIGIIVGMLLMAIVWFVWPSNQNGSNGSVKDLIILKEQDKGDISKTNLPLTVKHVDNSLQSAEQSIRQREVKRTDASDEELILRRQKKSSKEERGSVDKLDTSKEMNGVYFDFPLLRPRWKIFRFSNYEKSHAYGEKVQIED